MCMMNYLKASFLVDIYECYTEKRLLIGPVKLVFFFACFET